MAAQYAAAEARSLSSINTLASNPPQYPVKPNEAKLDDLTLYILRVPGTRDVFLSPFKPQVKSVTAEDVANSLYYVHLRDPSLDIDPPTRQDMSRESSPSRQNISRKPLPAGARPITPDSPPRTAVQPVNARGSLELSPPSHGHNHGFQHRSSPLGRRVVGAPSEESEMEKLSQVPSRKPLGPRPGNGNLAVPQEMPPVPPAHGLHPQTTHPHPNGWSHSAITPEEDYGSLAQRPNSAAGPGAFSLDLIRREPSSGSQWNVARISCHPEQAPIVESFGRSPSPKKYRPSGPIHIGIENSGYAKFRNIPDPSIVEAGPAAIMEALAERDSGRSSGRSSTQSLALVDSHSGHNENPHGSIFSREVTMSYTKSWSAAVKEKLQKLDSDTRSRKGHSRGNSAASWTSVDSGTGVPQPDKKKEGMRQKGFTFTSPWNGRCDFRTGNGGRTLCCTHSLDTANSSMADASTGRGPSTMISELRFNLPASEVLPGSHARNSNLFTKLIRRDDGGFEESDDEEDEVNGLGKERAGGGRRGNRAKMGKLIITGEGLKMLDLVVAANVGVWWESWERKF